MNRIRVNMGQPAGVSYDICIGNNILDRMGLVIQKMNCADRYIIISDSTVSALHGNAFMEILREMNLTVDLITFPAGEKSKDIEQIISIVRQMIALGADRNTALIAMGGGVTGDIVGFIASIYMRSIPCIQVPTTLLAQVDSSIGGKTGIDLPDGKNLLGTFSQPKMVLTDLHFLDTLPESEFNNGLAEIVKYGIVDDMELFQLLENGVEDIKRRNIELLATIVGRSCRIKKEIVEMDEHDLGLRRILNFGHTIGHAIESASGYSISHGNGVSIGMIGAARISEKLNYLATNDRVRIEALISTLGLLDHISESVETATILSRMKTDKKKKGDAIHFVLLKKLGMPFVNGSVEEGIIRETIEELRS
ncbi:MAG: 3-dehydroquinate synthase [Deltaproteobacteria bacterium]|nr:3-dehydroquinate synthase [Deltaproteobacteria bacterium]